MLAAKFATMNEKIQCIRDCLECHRVCQEMALYLHAQGTTAAANHAQLLFDCAAMCQAGADFMASDSDLQGRFCDACAELCQRCARECERFENDIQMKACIDACRRCGESCRQMAVKPGVTPAARPEWIDGLADRPHSIL